MVRVKTERLLLRSYEKGDAARIAEIANNKNIARNMADIFPFPYTLEEAEKWIEIATGEDKIKTNFVIIFEGEIVGGAGFSLKEGMHEGIADGGYWLGEDYWGKGFGTEAWKAVRDYGFENFDIRKLQAGAYSWNPASSNILEKSGFVKEGVLRDADIRFGDVCDEIRYGLLRKEWEELK
jgi:[ribosomal protein S5]-alanine N-acetyltransferase